MPGVIDVVVSVPYGDRNELTGLTQRVAGSSSAVESRSLDGVTIATALVAMATASIPVFRAWLVARLEAKKGCVVSFEGVSLQGYSADEVEKIVGVLRRELSEDGGSDKQSNDA